MVLSDGLAARLSEDLGTADTLEKELVDAEDDLAAAKEVMRLYEPVARRGAVLMQVATKLIQVGRRNSSSKVRHFFSLYMPTVQAHCTWPVKPHVTSAVRNQNTSSHTNTFPFSSP